MNNLEPHRKLRPLIRSEHWNLLEAVLTDRIEALKVQLIRCATDELQDIQGRVQELENILGHKLRLQVEESSKVSLGKPR